MLWISAQPVQTNFLNNPGSGDYTFHATFDLTGFDPATAQISGLWTIDYSGLNIRLIGARTGISAGEVDFNSFMPFSITSSFGAGTNMLNFIIHNEPFIGPFNPMGLRVELSGIADA